MFTFTALFAELRRLAIGALSRRRHRTRRRAGRCRRPARPLPGGAPVRNCRELAAGRSSGQPFVAGLAPGSAGGPAAESRLSRACAVRELAPPRCGGRESGPSPLAVPYECVECSSMPGQDVFRLVLRGNSRPAQPTAEPSRSPTHTSRTTTAHGSRWSCRGVAERRAAAWSRHAAPLAAFERAEPFRCEVGHGLDAGDAPALPRLRPDPSRSTQPVRPRPRFGPRRRSRTPAPGSLGARVRQFTRATDIVHSTGGPTPRAVASTSRSRRSGFPSPTSAAPSNRI